MDSQCFKRSKVEPADAGVELISAISSPTGLPDESTAQRPPEVRTPAVPLLDSHARIAELQRYHDTLIQESNQARLSMVEADTCLRSSRKAMTAFCSLQRSQVCMNCLDASPPCPCD